MKKRRKIKSHPFIDNNKPSLIRQEALRKELHMALESLKPPELYKDMMEQWEESQKALSEALKPPELYKDIMEQWKKSQKDLQKALSPSKEYLDAIEHAKQIVGVLGKSEKK